MKEENDDFFLHRIILYPIVRCSYVKSFRTVISLNEK